MLTDNKLTPERIDIINVLHNWLIELQHYNINVLYYNDEMIDIVHFSKWISTFRNQIQDKDVTHYSEYDRLSLNTIRYFYVNRMNIAPLLNKNRR